MRYDFGSEACSKRVFDNIKSITFRDATGSDYFYQQRWNTTMYDESPKVCDELPEGDTLLRDKLFALFNIEAILDKELPLFSSGEMRKFQITKALLTAPRVLILDNPFIGLDSATRESLHKLLGEVAQMGDVQIIMVLAKSDDMPTFITHIIEVENRVCRPKQESVCRFWLEIFGVEALSQCLFTQLSSGEQRLILLARAFVKNPSLLTLDEPLHGLDLINRRRVVEIIESYCTLPNRTLIMVTHYAEELPSNITHSLHLTRGV